jgi:hypothetical protein
MKRSKERERQKKMLIHKNEHSLPCYQASGEPEVTFDGRIGIDGITTAKTG